jgi:hypothetical protein
MAMKPSSPTAFWATRQLRGSFEFDKFRELDDQIMYDEASSKNLNFKIHPEGTEEEHGPYEQSLSVKASPGEFEDESRYYLKLTDLDRPE